MIGIKGGTQTWSTASQDNGLAVDKTKTLSASDQAKHFGEEDIGDVLNKVADPNWVDPAKMRKVGNGNLDKDAFLKLLLAQMKNQDPTAPVESHDMAAKLAQFTSLEKLTNIDDSIGQLSQQKTPTGELGALQLIGKAVSGDSAKLIRGENDDSHDVRFQLAKDAQEATVKIVNSSGHEVHSQKLANLKQGDNSFTWKGLDEAGIRLPEGEYKVSIEAKDAGSRKVHAETKFEGLITGVEFTGSGPVLRLGEQKIRLSEVKTIVDPSVLQKAQAQKEPVHQAEVVATQAAATNSGASTAELESNIAMDRGMMNKLHKATGGQ